MPEVQYEEEYTASGGDTVIVPNIAPKIQSSNC
jgi:hypothetical protein